MTICDRCGNVEKDPIRIDHVEISCYVVDVDPPLDVCLKCHFTIRERVVLDIQNHRAKHTVMVKK